MNTLLLIAVLVVAFILYRAIAKLLAQIPDRNSDFFVLLADDDRSEIAPLAAHSRHEQQDLEQSATLRSTSPTAIRLVHPT